MPIIEDFISQYSDSITILITIVLALWGFWKWLRRENQASVEKLRIDLLGEKKDGNGGYIGQLKNEIKEDFEKQEKQYTKDMDALKKDIMYEIGQFKTGLISQHKSSVQDMRYVKENISRIERSLEKITGGLYLKARRDTEYEDQDQDKKDGF